MSLVLDTSVLIAIQKKNGNIIKKLSELSKVYPLPPQLTFISYFEFLYGLKKRKPKRYDDALAFLNNFNVLHTTNNSAEILSELKLKYDGEGIVLSLADLMIASQVIENNLMLVTLDKDFKKISELKKIILELG